MLRFFRRLLGNYPHEFRPADATAEANDDGTCAICWRSEEDCMEASEAAQDAQAERRMKSNEYY